MRPLRALAALVGDPCEAWSRQLYQIAANEKWAPETGNQKRNPAEIPTPGKEPWSRE